MPDHPYGGSHSVECLTAPRGGFTGSCPAGERHAHGWGLGGVAMETRRRCVASPLYLASEVLSAIWDRNLLRTPSEAHREVEKAMIAQRDTLYVDHRNTAKTTLLDETGTVWQGIKFVEDTQLITHSSINNAKGISNSIRAHPTRNVVFRTYFPEYAFGDNADAGNILAWSWPCRTRGGREESVHISAAGTQTAGLHFDVVRATDWMNAETTPLYGKGSIEVMKALVDSFSQVLGLLKSKAVNPRAHWTVDSNRWHDGDKAGTIIRRDAQANKVVKIIRGVTGQSGNFRSSWPEVIFPEHIQEIHDSPVMTPAMFAANYRSDPLPDGGMTFKREWFRPYVHLPKGTKLAIVVDAAFSDSKTEKKATDRTGIVCAGFAPDGNLYVAEIAAGRWGPDEFVDRVFAIAARWHDRDPMLWLGMEDTGGTRGLKSLLEHQFRRMRRAIFVRDIKPGGKRKEGRMFALHGLAERFGVFVRENEHAELVEELLRFGVAEHDDLADCLAYRVMEHYYGGNAPAADDAPPLRRVPSGRDDSADGLLARIAAKADEKNRKPWQLVRSA